jgi:hypothetical protein
VARFGPTFDDYLNAVVGPQFDPPINFVMKTYRSLDIAAAAEKGDTDFAMLDPILASCAVAESTGDVNTILTIQRDAFGETTDVASGTTTLMSLIGASHCATPSVV